MDLLIVNAAIITGDGKSHHRSGQIAIASGKVAGIHVGQAPVPASSDVPVLDVKGATVLPGVVNAHAHGCVYGPAMPSGSAPFASSDVGYFRNRHLLEGTTSLLNVCGFALADERHGPLRQVPDLDVFVTTAHTPGSIAAALAADGKGLSRQHLNTDIDKALEQGAVALGEAGGGQTLGGGAQDYAFLPRAIERETGVTIDARQARALKELVLGRTLDAPGPPDSNALSGMCHELGLSVHVKADVVADIVRRTVTGPLDDAFRGMGEITAQSVRTGLPAIVHTALPSVERLLELAQANPGARLVAAHCNHSSFTAEEAVKSARRLRDLGVVIDVSTLDCISTHWRNTPENLDSLVVAGLVDTLSTDFAGGHWDGILEAVHRMIISKHLTAAEAVALATGNVARAFANFAGDRGVIAVGKRADLVIADSLNLSRVRHVMIGGEMAVRDGRLAGLPTNRG